jgi:hypothetical protein
VAAIGCILAAGIAVARERIKTSGRVVTADFVEGECVKPVPVFLLPVVLFTSAFAPVAVFKLPVVSRKSALLPMAVLLVPVVRLKSAASPSAVFAPG